MPSGSYTQASVGCPFYKWDDGKRRIVCEGIVDNSSISLVYNNRQDYSIQIETFCCQNWAKCEIHTMLMEKYEDTPAVSQKTPRNGKVKHNKRAFDMQMNLFDMLEGGFKC